MNLNYINKNIIKNRIIITSCVSLIITIFSYLLTYYVITDDVGMLSIAFFPLYITIIYFLVCIIITPIMLKSHYKKEELVIKWYIEFILLFCLIVFFTFTFDFLYGYLIDNQTPINYADALLKFAEDSNGNVDNETVKELEGFKKDTFFIQNSYFTVPIILFTTFVIALFSKKLRNS
jgi:hypothetical protein